MQGAASQVADHTGGKMKIKNVVRKARNTVNRGSKVAKKKSNFLDNHADLLNKTNGHLGSNAAALYHRD